MVKRLFDIAVAAILLLFSAPLLAAAALGILLSSPGPLLYRARRAGRNGVPFEMLKLRTMHVGTAGASAITAPGDARVFAFGGLIRNLKIDELPQFWNILTGDLSLVGPRAEDPAIVARDYNDWMKETLRVAPGVTSPGAIYNYLMADVLLDPANPEGSYVERMLTPKLALERAYIDRAGFFSDMHYVILTAWAIVGQALGRPATLPAIDIDAARRWAPDGPYSPEGLSPNART
jgi:lipopolysaccharide/colanic/teichoic acid biosynthesis glycosyltransferase